MAPPIHPETDNNSAELEALVDTGATFTKILKEKADSLDLSSRYENEVELQTAAGSSGDLPWWRWNLRG